MSPEKSTYLQLAETLTAEFQCIPCVQAVALGGSQTGGGTLDQHSDIDLYIYTNDTVPLSARQAIVDKLGTSRADLNLTFWDLGDEWYDLDTGIEVDIIYWDQNWITEQIDRVVINHQASMGYTTCFWRTILNSNVLYDPHGWFVILQQKCDRPFPEALKRAIIAKNHPVLRGVIPSYRGQITKALDRGDAISVNHRIAAFFASYFDVLFALNEVLNPGEKKLMPFTLANCPKLPSDFQPQVETVLQLAASSDEELLIALDRLMGNLDELLRQEGFDPGKTRTLE